MLFHLHCWLLIIFKQDVQGLVAWPTIPNLEVNSLDPSAQTRSARVLMLLLHALIQLSHILEDIMMSL